MQISIRQIGQLDTGFWEHLETELLQHLYDKHAEALEPYTDDELVQMVHAATAQARLHKMEHWDTVFTFAAYMFEISPDFYAYPVCRTALTRKGLGDRARLKLLYSTMTDADWTAADVFYEAEEWIQRAQGITNRYGNLN